MSEFSKSTGKRLQTDCCGCGACLAVCPQRCITMAEDDYGTVYPVIHEDACIHCGKCKNVCQMNHQINAHKGRHSYAAFSTDSMVYQRSASGGIASAIMLWLIHNDWFVMGVDIQRDYAYFRQVLQPEDIEWACNSKYVYADMYQRNNIYEKYLYEMKKRNCCFIGLPCQAAALKLFLSQMGEDANKILFIDILCHGVPNRAYLDDHISNIEKRKKKPVEKVRFRQKDFWGEKYVFHAFSANKEILYHKPLVSNEEYGISFLKNIALRENCYSCRYAATERISDIMLGDFDDIKKEFIKKHHKNAVSLVMPVTQKGEEFLKAVFSEEDICFEEVLRSVYSNEAMYRPAKKYPKRNIFLRVYRKTRNFDFAIHKAAGISLYQYYYSLRSNYNRLKRFLGKTLRIKYKAERMS